MINPIEKTIDLGDGRSITIETGKLAKQADGAVVVKMNNTVLLATVVSAKDAAPGVDFMPLSVEYREKFSAVGRFPGGFMKREARPSDNEILVCRLVDRALRPLFPEDFHAETFVTINLLSGDKEDMPDALAGLAASAALAVSDIPFHGPISEVRVCRVNGALILNPTRTQMQAADMELVVGATKENILMVEGEMKEVSEQEMLEAMKFAHDAIKIQCQAQIELMQQVGKTEKRTYCHEVNDAQLMEHIKAATYKKVYEVAKAGLPKHERSDKFAAIKDEYVQANYPEGSEIPKELIGKYYHAVEKEAVRRCVLDERVRLDGRKTDEIRPIWSEVDYLPGPHGSAVFTRGETQA